MINKTLLALVLLFFTFPSKAQSRVGLNGGVNLANVSITSGGVTVTPDALTSFHAGVLLESRLTERTLLQLNLLFSQKGYESQALSSKFTVNYIEIPVNLLYEVTRDFTLGGGIYAAHAINGKGVIQGKSSDYDFGAGKANRFDMGVNLIAGYEVIEGLRVSVNYTLGTANTTDNSYIKMSNKVWGFSLTKLVGER